MYWAYTRDGSMNHVSVSDPDQGIWDMSLTVMTGTQAGACSCQASFPGLC